MLRGSDHLVEPIVFDAADAKAATFALEAHDNGALRADLFMEECLKLYNGSLQSGEEPLRVKNITRVEQRAAD